MVDKISHVPFPLKLSLPPVPLENSGGSALTTHSRVYGTCVFSNLFLENIVEFVIEQIVECDHWSLW